MFRDGQLSWREGLFLQQHHMQLMQRLVADQFVAERAGAIHHPRGVITAVLDETELRAGQVAFKALHAVMPSGVEVFHGHNAKILPFNISNELRARGGDVTVFLAVPRRQNSGRNVAESTSRVDAIEVKHIFRAGIQQVEDYVTGGNRQEVEVHSINAWLTSREDDRQNMEYLPLLKVSQQAAEADGSPAMPREKPDYIPPILLVSGSRAFQGRLRQLIAAIAQSRQVLFKELRAYNPEEPFSPKAVRPMLRLCHLNAAMGYLSTVVETPSVTPIEIYHYLRSLLGNLAALHCYGAGEDYAEDAAKDPAAAPAYNHDDPNLWVFELFRKFNPKLLVGDITPHFRELRFEPREKQFMAQLDQKVFSEGKEFFIGIKNPRQHRDTYRQIVEAPHNFKLVPDASRTSPFSGAQLRLVDDPPGDLPTDGEWVFFIIERERERRVWQQIQQDPTRRVWIVPPAGEPTLASAQYSFFVTI